MENTVKSPVALLGLAGIIDIGAAPFIAGEEAFVAVVVAVLGVVTLAAAYGVARGAGWARGVGMATRIIDGLLALPAVFLGGLAALGAGVVVLVSAAAVVALARTARRPAIA